jgi:hypothetical protein
MTAVIFALLVTMFIISFIGDVITGFTNIILHAACVSSVISIVLLMVLILACDCDAMTKLRSWWS